MRFRDLLENVTVTENKVLKYFKTVKRELKAKEFEVSELQKDKTFFVNFKEVQKTGSDLTLLFKNNNSTKINSSVLIGWNNDNSTEYVMLPDEVKSIKDVINNIMLFRNMKGVRKTSNVISKTIYPGNFLLNL